MTAGEALVDRRDPAPVQRGEIVHHGIVWDVAKESFSLPLAGELTREFVAHPGAVAVVALDENDRVLLIQQYRHPIRHRDWEIPAGLLDVAGEPPIETARRELAEEADLVAASIEPLVSVFTTPGGNDEVVHVFLARELTSASATFARTDEEADIRLEWVALADVVDAILAGRMRNGILVAGVLAAAEKLSRLRRG